MAKNENTKAANIDAGDEPLVPVKMLVSEAGYGFRLGEVRGFAASVAKKMIEKGHAEAYVAKKSAE